MPLVCDRNPALNQFDITKIAKNYAKLTWNKLTGEYQNIFPRTHMKKHRYPMPGKQARYHHDQTLCLIRMYPMNSEEGIAMKYTSLNSILEEIVTRIPLAIKSK